MAAGSAHSTCKASEQDGGTHSALEGWWGLLGPQSADRGYRSTRHSPPVGGGGVCVCVSV